MGYKHLKTNIPIIDKAFTDLCLVLNDLLNKLTALKSLVNTTNNNTNKRIALIDDQLDVRLKLDQGTPQEIINGSPIFEGLQFNTTPLTSNVAEGLMRWNNTDGTVDLGMSDGNITMQVGQEMFTKVRNVSGSTITNGSLVYLSGRTGNRPTIELARGDVKATAMVAGMVTQDIDNNADGYMTTMGYIRQIDTRGVDEGEVWNEGDKLWLSMTLAGHATNVMPAVPNYSDIIGNVGVSGNVGIGSILLGIDRVNRLEDLKDVNGTSLNASGKLAVWDNSNKYFDFIDNINNYLRLDQATPQTVISGIPIFSVGIQAATAKVGDVAGGNYIEIEADGSLVFHGDATVFDDIAFPLIVKTTGANRPVYVPFAGSLDALQWSVNDIAQAIDNEIPHSHRQNSLMVWHVHFYTAVQDATDRAVKWEIAYAGSNYGGAVPTETTISAEVVIPANTPIRTHFILNIGNYTPVSESPGFQVKASLKRVTSTGTAPSVNPFCELMQLHFEKDMVGSRQIITK